MARKTSGKMPALPRRSKEWGTPRVVFQRVGNLLILWRLQRGDFKECTSCCSERGYRGLWFENGRPKMKKAPVEALCRRDIYCKQAYNRSGPLSSPNFKISQVLGAL